ncbi:MAG: transposase, partial [Burkholderiales bacterium]
TRRLQRLVEQRRSAVELRTQLTLQLQAVLKEYFPQALEWAGAHLASPLACAFLQRWPTLAALQRAKPATVRHFYTQHGARRGGRIDTCLAAIATAVPLTTDRAVIDSNVLAVRLLTTQLLALAPSIAAVERAIAGTFATHPDAAIFASFPGAGPALAPRLLATFGTDRTRFASAAAVQVAVGIAPVTKRSGKSMTVEWRWATSPFDRQTFHEFAWHSLRATPWARTYYAQQRARGHSHHASIRSLAFKWIRILWRCWQDRVPYDDARYVRALTLHRSPLSTRFPSPEKLAAIA